MSNPRANASEDLAALGVRQETNTLAAFRVSRVLAARDRDLYATKWFDYRFLTPWQATEAFVEAYREQYRFKWRKHRDLHEAEQKEGVAKGGLFGSNRELTSFWGARQFADELGVPYKFFVDHAFEAVFRIGWKKFPRPNQLYGANVRGLIAGAVKDAWKDYLSAYPGFSELPQYKVRNLKNLPPQRAHVQWVIERIRDKHCDHRRIAKACFEDYVLPVSYAIREFGEEQVLRARREGAVGPPAALSPASPELTKVDHLPGCFGFLHAPDLQAPECQNCQINFCLRIEAQVRTGVATKCGSDDPVAARKRARGGERMRKLRAKKKATSAVLAVDAGF
jgi:hypothetical protein